MFPSSFDPEIYKTHEDLKDLDLGELIKHYEFYGKNEGRKCSEIDSRNSIIEILKQNKSKTLEIGPFDCPLITGENVKYLDVLNKEELIDRCKKINRVNNIDNIPFIDYTNGLKNIQEKFDIVISCHSIEHQLSLIDHLNEVYNVLENNGYYVLIIPDKRYCFDHFIQETSLLEVLDDYFSKRDNHSIKSLIEHRCYTTHNDCARHWNGDHGQKFIDNNKFLLKYSLKEYIDKTGYIDVHNYQFTPDSFNEIITKLVFLNLTKFRIEEIYSTLTNSNEFFVILKR